MLPVYRRLVDAAIAMGKTQLDEPSLLFLVGGVARRHSRTLEEIWLLTLDEFGRLMDSQAGLADISSEDGARKRQGKGDGKKSPTPINTERRLKLAEHRKLMLIEMLTLKAIGSTNKVTRADVVKRVDQNKAAADFARDFGALKGTSLHRFRTGPGRWGVAHGRRERGRPRN